MAACSGLSLACEQFAGMVSGSSGAIANINPVMSCRIVKNLRRNTDTAQRRVYLRICMPLGSTVLTRERLQQEMAFCSSSRAHEQFGVIRSLNEGTSCWRAAASGPQSLEFNASVDEVDDEDEEAETEEEARRRNWKEKGWAPWEEIRTPEAQFAIDSLKNGEEEAQVSWEDFRKFNMKRDSETFEKELVEAAKKRKEEWARNAVKLEDTLSNKKLIFALIPPRDWPPPGWKVDPAELAYIREAHAMENVRVTAEDLKESNLQPAGKAFGVPRWRMFLKQYDEWVAANKNALDQEALEVDEEYYSGGRRTGKEYSKGMVELPFIYPGQHYTGVVTYINLYEGAFVYFGGVHDGWVPIRDNDWYEIRHHIKVNMKVHVEVIAKRDPLRFRFPVEMRFVDPNIDKLIFKRFRHPPIFGRQSDTNLDEVAREANRPYYPRLRPRRNPEVDEMEAPVHPYVKRLWLVHEAEQMVLEAEEGIHDGEEWEELELEEEDDVGDWANEPGILHETMPGFQVPTIDLYVDEKYLNLEAARAEYESVKKLAAEAKARGEEYEFEEPEGRFFKRVAELNNIHQQRWSEQKEALKRDTTCRLELGLPLEEPGRYADKTFWGKNPYDPDAPEWRHDYWGDPATFKEELRKEKEPRTRPEEPVVDDDEDDLLDVIEGEAKMMTGEGLGEIVSDEVSSSDADTGRLVGVAEDRSSGTVNGTATNSLNNMRDSFDVEEGDWKFVDNSEVDNKEEGDEGAGDELTNDDDDDSLEQR